MSTMRGMRIFRSMLLLGTALIIAACSEMRREHGYLPPSDEVDQLVMGVDTQASVKDALGTPSVSGLLIESQYPVIYYIKSDKRSFAFLEPQVVGREVLAIGFDEAGVMQNLEHFTLSDGQVVRLQSRVTQSGVRSGVFLRQLLGSIGQFDSSAIRNN